MTLFKTVFERRWTALAITLLVLAMGGTWKTTGTAAAAPSSPLSAHAAPSSSGAAASARSAVSAGNAGNAGNPDNDRPTSRPIKKSVAGKLNLNTATEDELRMLPTVGPSKAERIVTWRKKNGGFKRTADLRRVKGFGYKTFKRLEPFLQIQGDTTLAQK